MISHFLFGSADSTDYDVLILTDTIGTIEESKAACKVAEDSLSSFYSGRTGINANLAILSDGVLTKVFKGTVDEVNNSVYHTYQLHKQQFPLGIVRTLPRDFGVKAVRSLRIALSFMSRTQFRAPVKTALRGPARLKAAVLGEIDLTQITDLGKQCSLPDFRKQLAFQMGQVAALAEGAELYTKADIGERYPELVPFLQRQDVPPDALEQFKHRWLASFDATKIPQEELKSS